MHTLPTLAWWVTSRGVVRVVRVVRVCVCTRSDGEGNVTIDVNGQLKSAAKNREKKRDRQEPGETRQWVQRERVWGKRFLFFFFFFFCGVGEEGRHGKAGRES